MGPTYGSQILWILDLMDRRSYGFHLWVLGYMDHSLGAMPSLRFQRDFQRRRCADSVAAASAAPKSNYTKLKISGCSLELPHSLGLFYTLPSSRAAAPEKSLGTLSPAPSSSDPPPSRKKNSPRERSAILKPLGKKRPSHALGCFFRDVSNECQHDLAPILMTTSSTTTSESSKITSTL
ncbi:unnamed protein product [Caenorhabditis nigoni]